MVRRALEPLVGLLEKTAVEPPTLRTVGEIFRTADQSGTSRAKKHLLRQTLRERASEWEGHITGDWTRRLSRVQCDVSPAPLVDPASLAPEDLSARIRTIEVSIECNDDWQVPDLVLLSQRYGMHMLLQIGPKVSLPQLTQQIMSETGLELDELKNTIDVVRSRAQISHWGEDRTIPTASRRPTFLVPSTIGRGVRGRAKRYVSRDASHPLDHQFHGRVALKNEAAHVRGLGRILGRPVRTTKSHIEGGNLLSGTTSDGKTYALLGLDSLVMSAFDLDRRGEFTRRELAATETRLEREGAFTPNAVRAVASRLTLARTGKWLDPKEPSAAKSEDARRFMAVLELTKRTIADDLRLSPERLVMLTQPGYHIDMHVRPLAPGEVLVHHPRIALEIVERALEDAKATPWERRELREMKDALVRELDKKGPIYDQILSEIHAAGLIPIAAPGVFRSKKRRANFMNAIPGTAPSGETFYITNGTSIRPLRDQVVKFFKGLGVDHVHFVGERGGGESTLCNSEKSLVLDGGLDCREVHHAGVVQRAGQNLLAG